MTGLEGKVALVTGASRGSGAATARKLASAGAKVILTARSEEDLRAIVAEIVSSGGLAKPIVADIMDAEVVAEMVGNVRRSFGRLDILVNNAGGAGAYVEGGSAGLLDTSTSAWDQLFALNLRGPFILAREAARIMRAQGEGGSIINVGSVHGQFTRWSYQGYSAAKVALSELTRMWAVELGQYGIRVNEVAPGIIVAGRNGGRLVNSAVARAEREALVPLGRLGVPEDVASVILFLVSDAAAYVSGATILASGGWRGDMTPAPDGRMRSSAGNVVKPVNPLRRTEK